MQRIIFDRNLRVLIVVCMYNMNKKFLQHSFCFFSFANINYFKIDARINIDADSLKNLFLELLIS